MIRKTKKGYKVVSHVTGRSFGLYPSKVKAEQRLKQIKFFGKINKGKKHNKTRGKS